MEVRSIIKEKGWTIEKVASEMGINRVTLSQNLSGNPTIKTLQRIADVIGCKVGDFFRDEMEEKEDDRAVSGSIMICPHCGERIMYTVKAEKI